MAVKNLYKTKGKEKSIYSSSGAANSSHTAAAGARNTPQNNVWNAEQSTPLSQSSVVQKPKREKSPSELGEEVIWSMLKADAAEPQRQAAAHSAVQYDSGAAATKAAGNRKTAQYGDAAVQFGEPASYSSLSAAKPTVGNQKATPYGGAATAQYNRSTATEPALQKREKSPSERGIEVVRAMLEDDGLLEPPEPEGNEAPAGRTFTSGVGRSDIIGPAAYAARNAAPGNGLSVGTGNAGEDAGSTPIMPGWLPPWSMQDHYDPELAPAELKAGLGFGQGLKQLWDDTHIAPGMPVSAYLLDLVGNAMDTVLEGAWNGTVDYAQTGVNADLERQMQMAQQFAFLGGPYQMYADQITDTARSIQEALPEAAEKFRSHKAAEHTQGIEIGDVKRNPQNDRAEPESKALPNEKISGTLSKEQDSIQHEQKEWWEKSGASEPIDPDNPTYQGLNAALTDDDRAAGLRVVKINGEYYIDYTVVINTCLHEVEQEFRNHALYDPHALYDQELMLANIAWFIGQVNEYCPWDIKEESPWKMQFGNVHPLSRMDDTIAYNGQVVRAENLGNLTYGYLGRAMGWPAEILYLGGGVVNQMKLAYDSTMAGEGLGPWLNVIKPSVYSNGSYGDGENDYIFIKQGVELYEAVH